MMLIKMSTKGILILALLVSPLPFAQTNAPADSTNAVTTSPPIPEEARKHFVMGATLFKDAKTADDFSQVESEFKQATDLAPQWPDARYNLALTKEAAGDYSGAIGDLKIYQQFKLSADEARTAQDKIYAREAKEEKIEKAVNEKADIAAQEAAIYQGLDGGVWQNSTVRPLLVLISPRNAGERGDCHTLYLRRSAHHWPSFRADLFTPETA
jgi:hypothetical protein